MADCVPPEAHYWRHLAGFWVCGLINNFTYVIFLTGAEDLLTGYSGAILLANILPTLLVKSSAPLYVHRLGYRPRVLGMVAAFVASYLLVALAGGSTAPAHARKAGILLGIATASAASGLGELTFLACTSRYHRDTVGAWSSGTGGAGLVGASTWVFLRHVVGLPTVHSLLLMTPVPLVLAAAFFGLLDQGVDLRPHASLVADGPHANKPIDGSQAAVQASAAAASQTAHHRPRDAASDVAERSTGVLAGHPAGGDDEDEEDGERHVNEPLLSRYSEQDDGTICGSRATEGQQVGGHRPTVTAAGKDAMVKFASLHSLSADGGVVGQHVGGGNSGDGTQAPRPPATKGTTVASSSGVGGSAGSMSLTGASGGAFHGDGADGGDAVVDVGRQRHGSTLDHLLALAPFLCRYMVPLMLVYFFEYLINQAMFLPLGFAVFGTGAPPHAHKGGRDGGGGPFLPSSPPLPPSSASHQACVMYSILQTTYQLGVFISRSSLRVFPVRHVWALPVLQGVNVLVVLARVLLLPQGLLPPATSSAPEAHGFTLEIGTIYLLILWEGLLGGAAYVNVFYLLSKNAADEDRELALATATIADSVGISFAGAASLGLEGVLLRRLHAAGLACS